jgi:DNA primase
MQEEKLKILKNVLGNFYHSGQECLFHCPFCDHRKKKLSINLKKSVFKCWTCGVSGKNLGFLVRKFGNTDQKVEWGRYDQHVDLLDFDNLFGDTETLEARIVRLPEEFVSLANLNVSLSARMARKYLFSRGLTKADILKWKIGYAPSGEYAGRIIVPSFDIEGKLNFFVSRTYTKQYPTYMIPDASKDVIFNELTIDWERDITIVEGVFDAIKADNSIPLLGSSLKKESYILEKIAEHKSNVFLALDRDAQKKAQRMIRLFNLYGIEVSQLELGKYDDVGEMSKEEFQGFKNSSQIMDFENYLISKIGAL